MSPRIRLVKVIVQPVFVLDYGDRIEEIDHPPVLVPEADWPTYSNIRFPREVGEWQKRLDTESLPQPNRAQRRAAHKKSTRRK